MILFISMVYSKFVVYGCLLIFCLLFALRLDGIVTWNYWIIFLPLWIWKALVVAGCIVGSWIWWRHPHYRYVPWYSIMFLYWFQIEFLGFSNVDFMTYNLDKFVQLNFIIIIFICLWSTQHEQIMQKIDGTVQQILKIKSEWTINSWL